MMHDDEHPIGREHFGYAREPFQDSFVERRGVRGIEEDHIERFSSLFEVSERTHGILLENLNALANTTGGQILSKLLDDRS